MGRTARRFDPSEAELRRLHRVKQAEPAQTGALGPELLGFFKNTVQKRYNRLSALGEVWVRLVPETICEHCCLESFQAGTLRVLVDSSSHLYELKQLLLAGLQKQLLLACKSSGLRKISLKQGRWYDGDAGDRKISFA